MQLNKTLILLTILSVLSIKSMAQDYYAQFIQLSDSDKLDAQAILLEKWEKEKPNQPELYIAYYNYYVRKSRTTGTTLTKNHPENALTITDSLGNNVGYLSSNNYYNAAILQKAYSYIDKGIALHPNRLDLRFGKIYMLGETLELEQFVNEIKQTIAYAQTINDKWLWAKGKELDSPRAFFLTAMHDYMLTVYNTNDDAHLPYMLDIAESVLKYYPDHIQSLSNASIVCILTDQYKKALVFLLRAEKIAPQDIVVLNNIAEAYTGLGDKTNAIAYYDKMIAVGNTEQANYAKEKKDKL